MRPPARARREKQRLLLRALPGGGRILLERKPARAALDARADEEREAPRRQVLPVGGDSAAAGERARGNGGHAGERMAEQRIDACLRETRALRVGHRRRRAQAGPQDGSSLCAADHSGQLSSKRAIMPATAPQAAKVSMRPRSRSNASSRGKYMTAFSLRNGQLRSASSAVTRRYPRRRRINEQHGVAVAAEARGNHERAHAHILLAVERRNAQQVERHRPRASAKIPVPSTRSR